MPLTGRSYSAGSEYRYGFNGKEEDKDISEGAQDYGLRISDKRLGRFLSVDPLTKTYPWYTPYQFAGNTPIQAIDLDGGEPQSVVKTIVGKGVMTIAPEKDEPDQSMQKIDVSFISYEFSNVAAHLLGLVSGIPSKEIKKVNIRDASGTFFPAPFGAYNPFNGGGAMTLPSGDDGYDINFTDNFFSHTPKAGYGRYDFSDNPMQWLDLASHEVGHIKDIQDIGGAGLSTVYMATFIKGYSDAGSHDGYWREKRADEGRKEFRGFIAFVDKYYGKGKFEALIKNKNNSEKEIIGRIDQWWKQYQTPNVARAKEAIKGLIKNFKELRAKIKKMVSSVANGSNK